MSIFKAGYFNTFLFQNESMKNKHHFLGDWRKGIVNLFIYNYFSKFSGHRQSFDSINYSTISPAILINAGLPNLEFVD